MTKTTTTTAPATPDMPAEQAADLAALIERAEKTDPAALAAEAPADVPKLADEVAGAIMAAVQVLGPAFPSLRTIYTEATTQAAGAAIAGVCEKHGWLGGGLFGEYGEEIACVAVCGPLAFATWQAVRADLEMMRAKAKPDRIAGQGVDLSATPPPPAPAPSKTVQFGAPMAGQDT